MKHYKSYQVIFYSNSLGKDSSIVIACDKASAISKVLANKPYVTIIECIDISKNN
jgi:hypothetical protein